MSIASIDYLEIIRKADPEGLRLIYKKYMPMMAPIVLQNGGSRADLQDVFQDALVVVFEKARQPGFQLSSAFSTYLYGVCRNIWGNRLQKKSYQTVTLPDEHKLTPDDDIWMRSGEAEKNRIFWSAFEKLGAVCQQLLQLFFEQKSMEQIAQALGLSSVGFAKKKKFQCKENLIQTIQSDQRYKELMAH